MNIAVSAIRWQEPIAAGLIYELGPDHHLVVGQYDCPACQLQFYGGQQVALIPLGPGDSGDARDSAARGGWYSATAVIVHAACAGLQG